MYVVLRYGLVSDLPVETRQMFLPKLKGFLLPISAVFLRVKHIALGFAAQDESVKQKAFLCYLYQQ